MTFLGIEVGSWADWVSGIATFLAVVVTLKMRRVDNNKKVNVHCNREYPVPEIILANLNITVLGCGKKSSVITEIGFKIKGTKKRILISSDLISEEGKRIEEDQVIVCRVSIYDLLNSVRPQVSSDDEKIKLIPYAENASGKKYTGKKVVFSINSLLEETRLD
ncbi:hypothetical protein [Latilactobacillus curvatus]